MYGDLEAQYCMSYTYVKVQSSWPIPVEEGRWASCGLTPIGPQRTYHLSTGKSPRFDHSLKIQRTDGVESLWANRQNTTLWSSELAHADLTQPPVNLHFLNTGVSPIWSWEQADTGSYGVCIQVHRTEHYKLVLMPGSLSPDHEVDLDEVHNSTVVL